MADLSGADVLCTALKNEGVDVVFDLPGDPLGPILLACHREGIRRVTIFRHEQGAALAAQAWSYVTRRIGVALVASGPAMTNAITALETARANCWPLLLIGGSSELRRRGRGDFQECPQVEAAAPFCKLSVAVTDPCRVPFHVHRALQAAMSGRPGPVYLDLPADVITAPVEGELRYFPPVEIARPLADPEQVDAALEEIRRAERPLLIFGKGAAWSDAGEEARALVERLGTPFLSSPMGNGVVPDDHPACVAAARSYALRHADLIVAVGARLNWIFHFGEPPRFAPGLKVVQVDIDPAEIGRGVPDTLGLVGDARQVLGQLLAKAARHSAGGPESAWWRALSAERSRNQAAVAALAASEAAPMNLYRLFRGIAAVLDRDATVTVDGERTMAVSRSMLRGHRPRHRLDAGTSGCMGVAVPYAIGAQVARPGKQVLSVNGDWAFGFNGMEVETAAREKLPIVFLIANNGTTCLAASGRILGIRPDDPFEIVRYERLIEACGGHAELVSTPQELEPALERAFASGRAALVNVRVDPSAERKPQSSDWLARAGRMQY